MRLLKVDSLVEENETLRAEAERLRKKNDILETEAIQREKHVRSLTQEVARSKKALKRYKVEMGAVLAPASLAVIFLVLYLV